MGIELGSSRRVAIALDTELSLQPINIFFIKCLRLDILLFQQKIDSDSSSQRDVPQRDLGGILGGAVSATVQLVKSSTQVELRYLIVLQKRISKQAAKN